MALPIAAARTRWVLDQTLRREVIAADPAAAEARRTASAEQRRVGRPEPAAPGGDDGMATMTLLGPAEDLAALWVATDAAARHARSSGDDRTLDQLRFDLLTGLAWTALDTGHLGCCHPTCAGRPGTSGQPHEPPDAAHPRPSGRVPAWPPAAGPAAAPADSGRTSAPATVGPSPTSPPQGATGRQRLPDGVGDSAGPAPGPGAAARAGAPGGPVVLGQRRGKAATVHVTVPVSALAGAEEAPGELDGYGPITAGTARLIAADATVRRLLTDPADGRLLEYGRTTYAPPPDLAAHVIARDRTCRFPTCHRSATEAEIDHRRPYAHGGTTDPANTWALHAGHHRAKTWHAFTLTNDARGATWWITPAGLRYPVEPEAVGTVLATRSAPAPTPKEEVAPL